MIVTNWVFVTSLSAARSPFSLVAALGVALALSSSGRIQDQNTFGIPDVVLVAAAAVVYAGLAALTLVTLDRLPERTTRWLLIAALAAGTAFFFVAHHYLGPAYADSDEALDILGDSLIHGFNPYELRTYLGNTISPMMGAGLLALPFRAVFGLAAWQNPFWLLAGAAVVYRCHGPKVTLLVTTLAFACVGFSADHAFGGDYFVAGIALALAVHGFATALERRSAGVWPAAVFLGVAVTNRLSTLPFLAVIAATLYGAGRLWQAALPFAVTVAVSTALWAPWWLAHPAVYAPLQRGHFAGPQVAQVAVVAVLLAVLAVAASGRLTGGLTARFAVMGPVFAATVVPVAVFMPQELYRVAAFLFLAVPLLADRITPPPVTAVDVVPWQQRRMVPLTVRTG